MNPRVILITGGNGGLGLAMAKSFLAESTDNFIWLGVRENRDKAEALALENNSRCRCLDLDVTKPAAWQSALAKILDEHKRIDVLVNNAGNHADHLLAN